MGLAIGSYHVRQSIAIAATPRRVWEEFASFDRLAAWFSSGHTLYVFEPELGVRVDLSVNEEKSHFGGPDRRLGPGCRVELRE